MIPLANPFTVLIQIQICFIPSIRLILIQLGIFQFRKKIDRTFGFWSELRPTQNVLIKNGIVLSFVFMVDGFMVLWKRGICDVLQCGNYVVEFALG